GAPSTQGATGGNPGAANFGRTAGGSAIPSNGKPAAGTGSFGTLRTSPPPLPSGSTSSGTTQALQPGTTSAPQAAAGNPTANNFGGAPAPQAPAAVGKPAAGMGSFNGLRSAPPPVPGGSRSSATDTLRRTAPAASGGSAMSAVPPSNFGRAQRSAQ